MKKLQNLYKRIILIILAVSIILYLQITHAGIPPKAHDFTIPAVAPYKQGELLVRFAPKADGKQRDIAEKNQVLSLLGGGTIKKSFKIVPGLTLVKLPTGLTVQDALKTFNKTDGILYAEPNYRVRALSTFPNDPNFTQQWHLHNTGQDPPGGTSDADIDAPEGWDIQTGSSEIIVAVIDTGVDYNHVDLEDNMWINELELNGTPDYDDDGNGYKDDIYGYDFCTYGGKQRDSDPMDDEGHGTACAGLVGAEGNNGVGVTGVSWNVKIMALKFLSSTGWGYTDDAVDCVEYADLMDARVMSNSWGGGGYSSSLEDAIEAAKANGAIFIAASGNTYGSITYPAKYSDAMAVGATDEDDIRWNYSGYGPELNVVAPSGEVNLQGNLWTTDITGEGNGYDNRDPLIFDYTDKMGGTSGATPQVAGLAGLILSVNTDFSPDEVQFIIESTADDKGDSGWDQYYGWGRINTYSALLEAVEFPTDDTLVGWWKLDETSGVTAHDSSGYDNDGTLADSPHDPAWVNDPDRGRCLDFDTDSGEEDYVSLSPIGALTTDDVTMTAWINADTLTTGYHSVLTQYDYPNGYYFSVHNYKPSLYLNGSEAQSEDSINVDDWYHLAATYDGSNLKIYVDGVLKDTEALSGETGVHTDAYIGGLFDGMMEDVRVYNYSLDVVEIWYVMTYGISKFCIKDSLGDPVAWFDNLGNLFLNGSLTENVTPQPSSNTEFRIKNSGGTDVAIIDSTNGNMRIKGSLYEEQGTLNPSGSSDDFVIKNSSGSVVAYIDESGNLYLMGELYENPD